MFRVVVSAVVTLVVLGSRAVAFDPAEENYRINEAQRLDLMARQLDLNYRMIWQSGYGPRYPNPFEPWPSVPGDIWGYPSPRPIEHPIGYESKQTGPNRWIYRPIYAAELARTKSVVPPPAPTDTSDRERGNSRTRAIAPEKPRPSDLDPSDVKPQPTGPRAF